jgi:hypothetical protein
VQASKTPVSETMMDSAGAVIENHLAKVIVDRNFVNLKLLVEAAVEKPNTRRLFEQIGTEWLLFHRFALFMRLLGDNADDSLLNNFLKIFEGRIVVTEAGTTFEWTEDFLRCFKLNPAEFVNRPPLDPFAESAVAQLKKLCDAPDPGYIWKLDDAPPEGPWLRGILAEVDLYYHEYLSWTHLPAADGVDFVLGVQAAQLKTTRSNTAATIDRMRTAINALISEGRSRGCSQFKLDIRKKPGLDTTTMQAELDAYFETRLAQGESGFVVIQEYEFIPRD